MRVRRIARVRQEELPFLSRSRRLDRGFRLAILATTSLALAGLVGGTRAGRGLLADGRSASLALARGLLRLPVDRVEVEGAWARKRQVGIDSAREALAKEAESGGPALRAFLRSAKLDPESAVIGWGNFDRTLALSSAVFEPDDAGRSYRLRPSTRSVWLINLAFRGILTMFEVPDTPEARRLGEAVGGRVVHESVQTTNSWGCRGPEPDPDAAFRVMVLGDSNMQGLLVADDQSPPARLEARLRDDLKKTVSVLNTGHLGYSPEQYYKTLVAFSARFRPHFVVISLCANDFGDMSVAENWAEGEYWLDAIVQHCRAHQVDFLAVPIPLELAILGKRDLSVYPAKVSAIYKGSGRNYLDPVEDFATELLALKAEDYRRGRAPDLQPLFNAKYNDHHLSPRGCDLWAGLVARRVRLIVEAKPPADLEPVRPPAWPPGNIPGGSEAAPR